MQLLIMQHRRAISGGGEPGSSLRSKVVRISPGAVPRGMQHARHVPWVRSVDFRNRFTATISSPMTRVQRLARVVGEEIVAVNLFRKSGDRTGVRVERVDSLGGAGRDRRDLADRSDDPAPRRQKWLADVAMIEKLHFTVSAARLTTRSWITSLADPGTVV